MENVTFELNEVNKEIDSQSLVLVMIEFNSQTFGGKFNIENSKFINNITNCGSCSALKLTLANYSEKGNYYKNIKSTGLNGAIEL